MTKEFERFEEAPTRWQNVARYSLGVTDDNFMILGQMFGLSNAKIREILNHPVIRDWVEATREKRIFGAAELLHDLTDAQLVVANQLMGRVKAGEMSTRDLMKFFEMLGDRLPDGRYMKKTKIVSQDETKERQLAIEDLKAAAATNMVTYTPKKSEVLEIVANG